MRAFLSVSVPPAVGERLMTLLPPLKSIRRTRAAKLHLTLHFLSDAPADLAESLARSLEGQSLPPPFTLTPGKIILLPEAGPVRILAASVTGDTSALRGLHTLLGRELARLSLPTDPRHFLPHITLARCDPPLPQQIRSQTPMAPREDLTFSVNELHLIESRPVAGPREGFEYHTLRTWRLQVSAA